MKIKDEGNIQVIKVKGKPAFAVVPYDSYNALLDALEDYEDGAALDALDKHPSKTYPSEVINALIAGQNPFKVWREYRNIHRKDLAEKVSISVPYLSQLESGKRSPSIQVLQAVSRVLDVDMELLLFGKETLH
jgi:DNA-binding XRE family transcriptional regulator